MAQVSCELVAPKENRPNEGIMFFNLELSPMASPAFEQGRWGPTWVIFCCCLSVFCNQSWLTASLFSPPCLPSVFHYALNSLVSLLEPKIICGIFFFLPADSQSCQWSWTDSWRDAWGTRSALIQSPCVWCLEERWCTLRDTHTHFISSNTLGRQGQFLETLTSLQLFS